MIMSQNVIFTNTIQNSSLKCFEDELEKITIYIDKDYEPNEFSQDYYTSTVTNLPLTVKDLKKVNNNPSKNLVISNYIENLISNNTNNKLLNSFFESVNIITTLVSDIIGSTNNNIQKKDYCDAV